MNRFKIHSVGQGETLWSIAKKYQISLSNLLKANPGLSPNNYKAGTKIYIPRNQQFYQVEKGNTIWSISRQFSLSPNQLRKINQFPDNHSLTVGEKVLIGENYNNFHINNKVNSFPRKLSWPAKGPLIIGYGKQGKIFFGGVQIRAPNHKIRSASTGKVIFLGLIRGYGLTIIIDHGNKLLTIYSSKQSVSTVQVGAFIDKGKVIALQQRGKNNMSFFFQVWFNNRLENPIHFLKKRRVY